MRKILVLCALAFTVGTLADGKSSTKANAKGSTKKKRGKKKKYQPTIVEGIDAPEHECEYAPLEFGLPLVKANSTKVFGKSNAVVLFSSRSCTACCPLEHTARQVSENITKGVKFYRVDSDQERSLLQRYSITSVPAVLFFQKGVKTPAKLLEVIRAKSILKIAKRLKQPMVNFDSKTAEEEFLRHDGSESYFRAVSVIPSADSDEYEELQELASTFMGHPSIDFAIAESPTKARSTRKACHDLPAPPYMAVYASAQFEYTPLWRVSQGKWGIGEAVDRNEFLVTKSSMYGGIIDNARVNNFMANSSTEIDTDTVYSFVKPRVICVSLSSYESQALPVVFARSMLPPVGVYNVFTSSMYHETNLPIFMLFSDLDDQRLKSHIFGKQFHKAVKVASKSLIFSTILSKFDFFLLPKILILY